MDDPRVELVNRFFFGTGATYDFSVNFWTVGFDRRWKKKILEKIPANPIRIIDQACGTGILTFKIARAFPDSRVIGVELREEYLNLAKKKKRMSMLKNVEFVLGRAEDVLMDGSFDCITSSYLAKYAELETLIENARKMLRNGGLFIMHDFTYPPGRLCSQVWQHYFKLMQKVGSWIFPPWRTVFKELPALIHETNWVADLMRILRENNFSDIKRETLTFGTSTIVTARKV